MDFEWLEEKRIKTLNERGLDFRDAAQLFDGRAIYSYPSPREGEARFVSIGVIAGRFIAVVWTDRESVRRIISMRRARDAEERLYRTLLG